MIRDSPDPQNSGTGAQVSEAQPSLLQVHVTVLKANDLPRIKSPLGRKRQFYVTVTDGSRTWQTRSVRSVGQRVEWNEDIEAFSIQPLSSVTVSLYAKSSIHKDILIGRKEIPCESQRELDIILSGDDGHAGRQTESATLLTITVSTTNASSSLTAAVNTANSATADQDIPALDNQTEMSSAALSRAEDAINTMESWSSAVDVIKRVMDTVSAIAALQPYANLAWSLLSKIPQTLLQQVERDDNVRALFEAIRVAFEFTKDADALRRMKPESRQARILEEMLQCVSEIGKFIELYAKHVRVGTRTLKNIFGQVDGEVEQYRTTLIRLREDFLGLAAVTTEVAVLGMQHDVSKIQGNVSKVKDGVSQIQVDLMAMSSQTSEAELGVIIRELPYKGGWRHGDKKRCLPGTREDFLDYFIKWVENPESDRGLLLLGQAGTGKSSIAHEVARRFENKCLGSYFAFLRKEQSKDEAYQLFTTIARDLSDRNPAFKLALGRVVKNNSSLCGTRDYHTLFESLLLEPLKNLEVRDPILIVIDALDESGDAIGKNGLHVFLSQHLFELPPKFRILITSRPDDGIEAAFAKASSVDTLYMDDPTLAAKTEQDICLYIESELPHGIFKDHGMKLAKAAEGLFQWAAVACGFINSPPAMFGFSKKKCVQRLLGHSRDHNGQDPLDKLYEEVLEGYFKPHEAQILFRSVMGQLFAAVKPLSLRSLITLRRYAPIDDAEDSEPVLEMLRHLGSLLSNVTSSDETRPIVPLHTSFRDFLTNKKSIAFYVDLGEAHRQLAHACLGLMLDDLKFNICELESSYFANCDVPDLESRISKFIPDALSYACLSWDNHLKHFDFDHDLFTKLGCLLETKFLFWLEVLSVKSSVGFASRALSSLTTWLHFEQQKSRQPSGTEVGHVVALANDASSFVRYFGMAIAKSAPHIYISALPFAPSSSHIFKHFIHLYPYTLSMERGQLSHWPALEMVITGHRGPVYCVAFSPDGQRIASGSGDRTICVWDATTGEVVAGPFTGHTDSVMCVVFSPDGQCITSASLDSTIRVWDATTGEVVVGPITGHTDSVESVAFSPGGHRIASASADRTIRVWDAATGEVVVGPFIGHTNFVTSVVFSPDGQCIASASHDRTIRIWNAATGEVVVGPIIGHTNSVWSVAFSPDGRRIASASADRTIRMWDVATGEIVVDPFIGHAEAVFSVAFSPDGLHIASASQDSTTRVWDAATGEVVAGPFIEHTDSVFSVAFSPDGQRVASASADLNICVWRAAAGEVAAGNFTGHTNSVLSVAFSPDGQRIASASADCKICVWDATTGEIVAGPFTGHNKAIFAVVFSPDGQRIASSSDDHTICVWNAATGEVVAGPFIGHTDWVRSVAFSPNGQHIASASSDCTIRVWDAATGEVIVGPFTGHTDWVRCVAFSPNGQRIASASFDCTIRMWDATTGEIVAGPFTGHTDYAVCVAFSPDGQRIASASQDCTIRVWDATTGEVAVGPFTGNTHTISSVAFSPDGQRIASASFDSTISLWNSATGEVIAGPSTGHSDHATSVAFSPDGKRLTSASDDQTIRMWDVTTWERELEAGSSTGLTQSGLSVPSSSSSDRQLITSASQALTIRVKGRTDNIEKVYFMDRVLVYRDGWMCGEEGELFLWVPQIHRAYIQRSNTVWIAGRHYTQLDFSNFVHGSNWATVYVHSSSK